MRTGTTHQKLMAVGLCALLVSCSAARHVLPHDASAASPSSFVLIIEERPDGQITHSWQSTDSVTRFPYQRQPDTGGQAGRLVPVAARQRDCDEENRACYQECMARPLPRGYGSFTSPRKSGGKSEFCRRSCQQAYNDCLELEKLRPQEFTSMDSAVDWLKRHRMDVLAGSIIVIAGVTFVVVSAGAAAVVLAPVVLMISAEASSGTPGAEGAR
ncbi:hypothetical protein CYFUS_003789 [Cystobacter fuscus]|uniref:Lipoprotein n=2 Tax=Cystobacter fuscus TaxID=43 RepID=A0A250J309_9BACT|nr:hypothetical protein CYFUS_003789 [Cystobacter fuscus]